MKHTFAKLTPVALACGLAMNPVMAEDVMKVYGQVNVSYDNTSMNDAAEAYEVAKGNWVGRTVGSEIKSNASRLGMLGSLDTTLDQTKLIYKAEFQYGVAGNNGLTGDQSDQLFVREAFAGLKNKQYGKLRMGRFTVGYKSSYTKIDPWTDHILQARQSGQQGASNLNSNYFNYAVEYTTPKFNGIEFNAHYSVLSDESNDSLHNSGKLKDFKGGDASGFGVKYSKSGLRLTADMVSINSENDPGETDATKATNGSAWHVTGQYKFDSGTTLAGHYEDASDLHLGNNIFAIVSQKIGKNGLVTASYGRNEGATDNVYGEEDSHTYNIGAKYKLTKKSALIAGYSHHERDDKDAQTITLGIDAKFGY